MRAQARLVAAPLALAVGIVARRPLRRRPIILSPRRLTGVRQRMTTRRDEEKLHEVADQHCSDDPALAAQLYAEADYLTQLRKAPTHVNRDEVADDA